MDLPETEVKVSALDNAGGTAHTDLADAPTENPIWGQEQIAYELLLKFGLRVSPRMVAKYMPTRQSRADAFSRVARRGAVTHLDTRRLAECEPMVSIVGDFLCLGPVLLAISIETQNPSSGMAIDTLVHAVSPRIDFP